MAWTPRANVGTGGTANGVTSASIDTSSSDLLIVGVSYYFGIDTSPTLSDSKSNSWNPLTSADAPGNLRAQLFYAHGSLTVGSGHTFSLNGTAIFPSIYALAWSGSKASMPFDQQSGGTGSSVSTVQPGSVTPSDNDELLVTLNAHENGGAIPTINGGFTVSDGLSQSSGNYEGGGMAYLTQTSAAAANPTWDVTNTVSSIAAAIATFKGASAPARPVFMPALRFFTRRFK